MIKRLELRVFLGICAAFAFWGLLYPEFTFTSDTYRIVDENGNILDEELMDTGDEAVYMDIIHADRKQIRFRSRILDFFND